MAKIMIVEDEPTIRIELATLLTRYGYEVQTPTNFQNILAIIEREDLSLIHI